ncbi:MAG TPA: TlpA disulfide reductase family protein [Blastocatellia bacterium]|nr:TlpA disulfide reductase family protein [Blastocatellia bacterium]HMY71208.1 TlpA disulfide reductase family protein [Blastocatellia bacterium]HMZ19415.1 TlpA disulfide reductase family protein [Blastocatellia bacterium]HNG30298.1 TlpA disulfide reductase family protein [Blastocatellia bacterium]
MFCSLLLSSICLTTWPGLPAAAQGRKPSQVLRDFAEQQRKLQERFDQDVSDGKAQVYEWETRIEPLRKLAVERVAGFKIADWKGDELLALATLYQRAELSGAAANAYRAWLTADSKSRTAVRVRQALINALIESERLDETQKLLEELFRQMPEEPFQFIPLVGLHKDLAFALYNLGQYDAAAKQAQRGYDLAQNNDKFRRAGEQAQAAVERDRISLAAIFIAAQEKEGFQKEAQELSQRLKNAAFDSQPGLKQFFEMELANARLLGTPAPELVAARWLGNSPEANAKSLADLRGKVVLLDFWAMWYTPCVAAFPHFREFQTKYGGKGLEIVGVTQFFGRSDKEEDLSREDEWKALQAFKSKHQLNYSLAVGKLDDITNNERYGIAALPTVILIDRRGNIRHIKRGVGEYRKLEKQIERLIGER